MEDSGYNNTPSIAFKIEFEDETASVLLEVQ